VLLIALWTKFGSGDRAIAIIWVASPWLAADVAAAERGAFGLDFNVVVHSGFPYLFVRRGAVRLQLCSGAIISVAVSRRRNRTCERIFSKSKGNIVGHDGPRTDPH
jgi:hypothetical protein